MIRSMTGFGAADGVVGGGRVSVEVRSVNHRFFSPSIKLPSLLARWEGDVREALRRKAAGMRANRLLGLQRKACCTLRQCATVGRHRRGDCQREPCRASKNSRQG